MKLCFKMRIPIRGLLHDLSKYSITELKICKYYNGVKSPHDNARAELGYSPSWTHHKYRNKHHWQYWLDDDIDGNFIPIKIPYKYVVEQFCDMVGASKVYMKEKYNCSSPKEYYMKSCLNKRIIHKESEKLLLFLFELLSEFDNESRFVKWYRDNNQFIEFLYETSSLDKLIKDITNQPV